MSKVDKTEKTEKKVKKDRKDKKEKKEKKEKLEKPTKTIKKAEKTAPELKSKMSRRFNKLRLKAADLEKGIVYIGHLPKGFEEEELKKFFA